MHRLNDKMIAFPAFELFWGKGTDYENAKMLDDDDDDGGGGGGGCVMKGHKNKNKVKDKGRQKTGMKI